MQEPTSHTPESRNEDYVAALKRELAGAKQRQSASAHLDDVAKATADSYVKDVSAELARVTAKPAGPAGAKSGS